MSDRIEIARLAQAAAARARRRAWLGIRRVPGTLPAQAEPESPPEASRAAAPPPSTSSPTARASSPPSADPTPAEIHTEPAAAAPPTAALAQGAADLEELRTVVAACTACDLCRTRTQTVFSDGSARARVLFIGEAPGQNEDEQGVPFVGRAGQLLTDIVQKGMGLRRDEVYIANVLKCRPPENRDPTVEEKRLCTPFLDRQIELIDPDILITLGTHASQHVLERVDSMRRLRGRVHRRRGRKVVATYHPAYLLRSPRQKAECWKDIQLAMTELGLPLPQNRQG